MVNDRLLKDDEACERLGISRAQLYKLRQSGEIPAVHIGTAVRTAESSINVFIQRKVREALKERTA